MKDLMEMLHSLLNPNPPSADDQLLPDAVVRFSWALLCECLNAIDGLSVGTSRFFCKIRFSVEDPFSLEAHSMRYSNYRW